MTWNHRVFRTRTNFNNEEVYMYTIREVYYNGDGSIIGWTVDDITPYGESLEELKDDLLRLLVACGNPVLEVDPENENKLIGVDLAQVVEEEEEYRTYDSIEELLADLDSDD